MYHDAMPVATVQAREMLVVQRFTSFNVAFKNAPQEIDDFLQRLLSMACTTTPTLP